MILTSVISLSDVETLLGNHALHLKVYQHKGKPSPPRLTRPDMTRWRQQVLRLCRTLLSSVQPGVRANDHSHLEWNIDSASVELEPLAEMRRKGERLPRFGFLTDVLVSRLLCRYQEAHPSIEHKGLTF